MHEHPRPHSTHATDRVRVILAVVLGAVAIAASVALGHHPAGAQSARSADPAAAVTAPRQVEGAADPSLPAAADALRAAPHESAEPAEPASTF